jgi:hypothetical protein
MEYNSLYNKYNAEGERNILKNENWVGSGNADKREFYIAESVKNTWSSRQLESQIDSSLFEKNFRKVITGKPLWRIKSRDYFFIPVHLSELV